MRLGLPIALVACLAHAAVARAQLPDPPRSPTDDEVARGRAAFVSGMAAAREREWELASERFLESYALSGSPVALFNAGTSLSSLGRHREATEALLRVVNEPSFDQAARDAITTALEEAGRHVAILSLHGVPVDEVSVRLDGRPLRRGGDAVLTMVLDPGHHVVVLEDEARRWEWRGDLAAGERVDRNAVLHATRDEHDDEDDSTVWIVLGVLAGLGVGALIAGLAVDAAVQLDPRSPFVIELP
ncbi:MAG: tol-pal system YbgF family protein [Sandaracinaceae bacterium]